MNLNKKPLLNNHKMCLDIASQLFFNSSYKSVDEVPNRGKICKKTLLLITVHENENKQVRCTWIALFMIRYAKKYLAVSMRINSGPVY